MNRGEQFSRADEQSLVPLLSLSNNLIEFEGRLQVVSPIEVPLDENEIPNRVDFIRKVLGSVVTDHYWTGFVDVHHIAWPRTTYRDLKVTGDPFMAHRYRECASLKLRIPRQLHNYIHMVTFEPPLPPDEVMRQWLIEQTQVNRLYVTVRQASLKMLDLDDNTKEQWRYSSYMAKLETMQEGQLGLMPDREYLANLDISQARQTLRSLATVRGFNNMQRSKERFFKEAA